MNIFESLNKVMEDIGAIAKSSKNQTQGFMYRGVDAVMNALQPALIKHKVFVVPNVLDIRREERINAKGTTLIYSVATIQYSFYAEDGTSVSAIVVGEGMDSGDKSMNKAMSVAFKYACFQVLCIPTEEMVDPDQESHYVVTKDITPEHKAALLAELNRTGVTVEALCQTAKVKAVDDIPDGLYESLMKKFKATPDRK